MINDRDVLFLIFKEGFSKMKKFFLFFCLSFLLPEIVFAGSVAGTVSTAVGHPKVIRNGSDKSSILIYGDKIFVGDKILTGLTGNVLVSLNDGSEVSIGNNSEFVIDKFVFSGNSRDTLLNLIKGKMKAVVKHLSNRMDFIVKTSTAVAGVRGTEFILEIAGGNTNIFLLSGELKIWGVGNKDKSLILKRGMKSTVPKGGTPSVPKPFDKKSLPKIFVTTDKEDRTGKKSAENDNIEARYSSMIDVAKKNVAKIALLKSDAKKRNDKVVVNCIKPKLNTAKRLLSIANGSYSKLVSIKNKRGSSISALNNLAKKIKMSCDRIAELLKDAQSCLSISSGEVMTKTEIIEGKEKIEQPEQEVSPNVEEVDGTEPDLPTASGSE